MYTLAFCAVPAQTVVMTTQLWQRLRQARRYADLTQTDLAGKCGVSRGAVALWEAEEPEHRTRPTTDHLIAISKATNVPLDWLLNDASRLEDLWRLGGEFGDTPRQVLTPGAVQDVLPDLLQDGHLFLFAKTPEQIAAKLVQLKTVADGVKPHLILLNGNADVHITSSAAEALSVVVQILSKT